MKEAITKKEEREKAQREINKNVEKEQLENGIKRLDAEFKESHDELMYRRTVEWLIEKGTESAKEFTIRQLNNPGKKTPTKTIKA